MSTLCREQIITMKHKRREEVVMLMKRLVVKRKGIKTVLSRSTGFSDSGMQVEMTSHH